jgi:hypothetical protein
MSLRVRVGTLLVAFLLVVGFVIFAVVQWLQQGNNLPVITASQGSGNQVSLVLQETPETTVSNKPDWVSYFIRDPNTKKWVHTTLFKVPAGAIVHVTVLGYDGCTPPRNLFFGQVTGTIGNYETINGKKYSTLDGWTHCTIGHTFSIPSVGLSVPMGTPTTVAANNALCETAPCQPVADGKPVPHSTMKFSFKAPTTPGNYMWQCRIPCGGGFVDGFGGPMQTIGYMTGNMEVS